MGAGYRERVAAQLRNGFETRQGLPVIWQALCWEAMAEGTPHAMIRPISTEARATWAKRVLEAHYPGRVYEVNSYLLAQAVASDQLEAFESLALDDVTKIELGDKLSTWA